MPADLQALLEVRQRIKEGRIEAPFSFCSHCKNGCIEHFDAEHASRWLEMCKHCHGTGRIFLQTEPDFTTRLRMKGRRVRMKWRQIRGWNAPRWLKLTVGTLGCLTLIAVGYACAWLWMAL